MQKKYLLGFDSKGNIVNQTSSHSNSLNWAQISERSSKVISFIGGCVWMVVFTFFRFFRAAIL